MLVYACKADYQASASNSDRWTSGREWLRVYQQKHKATCVYSSTRPIFRRVLDTLPCSLGGVQCKHPVLTAPGVQQLGTLPLLRIDGAYWPKAGSMMTLTSSMVVAGKPETSACFLMACSSVSPACRGGEYLAISLAMCMVHTATYQGPDRCNMSCPGRRSSAPLCVRACRFSDCKGFGDLGHMMSFVMTYRGAH